MSNYTIKDIARIAGVGVTTVSRVINNYDGVSNETRARILEIIEKHNYTPNSNAKSLKQLSSQMICIIVKGISNPFFSSIVIELQKSVEAGGYISLVSYIDEDKDEIRCARQLITEKKPVGIIFLGGSAVNREEELENLKSPCVFVTSSARTCNIPGISSVAINDKLAAKNAVNYLLDLGHKDILIMGGIIIQRDLIYDRYEGILEAFSGHGMIFDKDNMYIESKFSYACAYEVMSKFLQSKKKFTAIFAMSDIMAVGAAKCVIDHGLKIPDDVSLIGFDGIDEVKFYNPTIATVKQPYVDISRKSVALLIKSIKDNNFSQHLMLNGKLVKGNSVKLFSS